MCDSRCCLVTFGLIVVGPRTEVEALSVAPAADRLLVPGVELSIKLPAAELVPFTMHVEPLTTDRYCDLRVKSVT